MFTRHARSTSAIAWVATWWIVVLALYFVLNASPIIALVLACVSLPALIDIGAGATSRLCITRAEITWRTGRRKGALPRGQLKSVRLDTRLDLSLRMTLLTYQGDKIRLPYECVPSASKIEAGLKAHDIPYQRHHFTLLF